MRNGLAISSALHVGIVIAAVYGMPQIISPLEVREQQIIVELVTVAKRTISQIPVTSDRKTKSSPEPEAKQNVAPKTEINPEKAKTPQPIPVKPTPPPPPRQVKTKSDTITVPPKVLKIPKNKPKPPKIIAKDELSNKFRALPRPRIKPKRKPLKFDADRIAALLDKDIDKKPQPKRKKKDWKQTVKELSDKSTSSPERFRSTPMTMSEIDAIRYQIQQCWSIPAGARDAEKLVIRIKVFLNTDGSLSKAPEIVDTMAQTNNPFYLTAAESARRAVLKCAPLKNLPIEKFARWREITLTFNPREMLGG